ncbi:MAG: hypothetical protein IJB63_07620 [Alistipes sp.]|nr:hypothetical protein [Alistipes sp.]
MKKSIYLSLIAIIFSVASFAQEANKEQTNERKAPTVEEIAKRRADRLRNELLLGNDQYDKVYKLCLAQAKKDKARQEEMKAEKEAFAKDMEGILNEAQNERFEQMQKPRMRAPQHNMQRRKVDFRNWPQFKQPAPNMQRGGQLQPSREEIMRKRKMFDDVQQQPAESQQAPQANAELDLGNLTANYDIAKNVVSMEIMTSVEADLLG